MLKSDPVGLILSLQLVEINRCQFQFLHCREMFLVAVSLFLLRMLPNVLFLAVNGPGSLVSVVGLVLSTWAKCTASIASFFFWEYYWTIWVNRVIIWWHWCIISFESWVKDWCHIQELSQIYLTVLVPYKMSLNRDPFLH